MTGIDQKSVIVTLLNMLLAGVGSLSNLPFDVVAGLTVVFIVISILAASVGTILAIIHFPKSWIIGLVLSILAVPALLYYSSLLALGGLTFGQIISAGFLYFYIFFTLFFVITYLENLLGHFIPPQTKNAP